MAEGLLDSFMPSQPPRATPEVLEELKRNGMLTADLVKQMDNRDQSTAFKMLHPDEQKKYVQNLDVSAGVPGIPGLGEAVAARIPTMGTAIKGAIGGAGGAAGGRWVAQKLGLPPWMGEMLGGAAGGSVGMTVGKGGGGVEPPPGVSRKGSGGPLPPMEPPSEHQPLQMGFGFDDMNKGHSNSPMLNEPPATRPSEYPGHELPQVSRPTLGGGMGQDRGPTVSSFSPHDPNPPQAPIMPPKPYMSPDEILKAAASKPPTVSPEALPESWKKFNISADAQDANKQSEFNKAADDYSREDYNGQPKNGVAPLIRRKKK